MIESAGPGQEFFRDRSTRQENRYVQLCSTDYTDWPAAPGLSWSTATPKVQNLGLEAPGGCGAFIVIGVIASAIVAYFLYQKASQVAEDFEKNPGMAVARMVIAANPDVVNSFPSTKTAAS